MLEFFKNILFTCVPEITKFTALKLRKYAYCCLICTINSKINGTPKGLYLPISKLHSILDVANLLAYNNLWLCYYGQVNSFRLK